METMPKDRKKVIFIDEMPWIDTLKSDFVSALENFWNSWANRRYDIVLVASGSATSWMGLTFELICMQHHKQIKQAIGISGMATSVSVYTWKCDSTPEHKCAQIDMLIERADRMIHLCEMKYSQSTYNIDKAYATTLRERMGIFNQVTKNKKGLLNTFVTTFGLGEGKHTSLVHSEVTMDDLFK